MSRRDKRPQGNTWEKYMPVGLLKNRVVTSCPAMAEPGEYSPGHPRPQEIDEVRILCRYLSCFAVQRRRSKPPAEGL